jgi:predicted enzyme related to lactoylglutathione lyase
MARVTGVGGVLLRTKDPKALAAWYEKHLKIKLELHGGAVFRWADEVPKGTGTTAWGTFAEDTTYFGPRKQPYMINYRVDDLDALVAELSAAGVTVDPERQSYDFGHFAWIVDLDGNRVELWQPLEKPST